MQARQQSLQAPHLEIGVSDSAPSLQRLTSHPLCPQSHPSGTLRHPAGYLVQSATGCCTQGERELKVRTLVRSAAPPHARRRVPSRMHGEQRRQHPHLGPLYGRGVRVASACCGRRRRSARSSSQEHSDISAPIFAACLLLSRHPLLPSDSVPGTLYYQVSEA